MNFVKTVWKLDGFRGWSIDYRSSLWRFSCFYEFDQFSLVEFCRPLDGGWSVSVIFYNDKTVVCWKSKTFNLDSGTMNKIDAKPYVVEALEVLRVADGIDEEHRKQFIDCCERIV